VNGCLEPWAGTRGTRSYERWPPQTCPTRRERRQGVALPPLALITRPTGLRPKRPQRNRDGHPDSGRSTFNLGRRV